VTGWCKPAGSDAIQWDSSKGAFSIFVGTSKGAAGGILQELQPSKPSGNITSLAFAGSAYELRGWAVNYVAAGANPATTQILYTADSGRTWSVRKSFEGEVLKSVHFRGDGRTGWVAGDNGVVLSTVDGGANWWPVTAAAGRLLRLENWTAPSGSEQYVRFVPPWYLLALFICGVLATPVLFPTDTSENVDQLPAEGLVSPKDARPAGAREADASTIGNQAIADKPLEPGDPDALGLSTIAAGLAFFLRNEKTKPPLAIAING
jgi:hypothetical protein